MRLHTNQAPFQTMAYFSHQLPFSAGNEMLGKWSSPIFVVHPRDPRVHDRTGACGVPAFKLDEVAVSGRPGSWCEEIVSMYASRYDINGRFGLVVSATSVEKKNQSSRPFGNQSLVMTRGSHPE
jgi:hypothetical protein